MHPMIAVIVLSQLLPAAPVVKGGLADIREPRIAIGFVQTNLLADELIARPGQSFPADEDLADDVQGVVELATNFPLWSGRRFTVSLQGGATSRFRLERSDNDALSVDYMVAFPVNYSRGPWEGRVRLMHRSAHLGDESVQNAGLRRLEYDHEEVDALIVRRIGPLRVYGSGTLTLASSFNTDDWGVGLGVETKQGALYGGAEWQRHTIHEGNDRFSAVAGVELSGPGGRIGVEGLFSTGASPLGEFFLERERFWGVRVVLRPLK